MARHHSRHGPRLLERDAPLGALLAALEAAEAGRGSTALVFGEAGSARRAWCARSRRAAERGAAAVGGLRRPRHAAHARPAARRRGRDGRAAGRGAGATSGQVFTALLEELATAADGADRRGRALGRRRHARRARLRRAPGRGAARAARADAARRGGRSRASAAPAARHAGRRPGAPARARRRSRARPSSRWPTAPGATPTPCTRSRAATRSSSPRRWRRRRTRCRPASRTRCWRACGCVSPECRDALERLSVVPSTDPGRPGRGAARRGSSRWPRPSMAGLIELRAGRARVPARAGAARDRAEPAGDPAPAAQPGRGARAARRRAARPRAAAAPRGRGGRRRRRCSRRARRRRARRPARARTARRWRTSRRSSRTPARLEPRERAALLDDYGWELYNAHHFREAVDAAREAERLYGSSASRSRWRCAWCGSRATCSWRARPTRPRRPRSARSRSCAPRATPPRWPTRRCTSARSWR